MQAHLKGSFKLIAKKYDEVYADLLIFNEYENRNDNCLATFGIVGAMQVITIGCFMNVL